MKISVHHRCPEAQSYRAARVKSLFNVDSGATFNLEAELPIEDTGWKLGLVIGPSGSGKSSIGQRIFGPLHFYTSDWPEGRPIIDAIAPKASFDDVTAALAAVGLGSVPSWLRPYSVLSTGERFRADLAKIVATRPGKVVVDEFTSVVDRQIARIGAMAFGKAWRRGEGQAVLLSCHYDIVDWLQPDWIYDTASGQFSGRGLQRRPSIEVEIFETDWRYWSLFEPHHYLKLPKMIAARCYVGFVGEAPVAHVAVSTRPGMVEARACRLVVMPEWQGAGVGVRFLNAVCELWRTGQNMHGLSVPTLFHTSHPGLAAALRRDPLWLQISAMICGSNKAKSKASIDRSAERAGWRQPSKAGYGGHFRAVQGFRYYGPE
jgi:GNAT superfamily N-acetyltransferase